MKNVERLRNKSRWPKGPPPSRSLPSGPPSSGLPPPQVDAPPSGRPPPSGPSPSVPQVDHPQVDDPKWTWVPTYGLQDLFEFIFFNVLNTFGFKPVDLGDLQKIHIGKDNSGFDPVPGLVP